MTKFRFFLAAPYDSKYQSVRAERARRVSNLSAYLVGEGHTLYSPICMFHNTAIAFKLPKDAGFWLRQNMCGMESCWELAVLLIPGFDKSIGVKKEVEEATNMGMPISLIWVNPKSKTKSTIGTVYTEFFQQYLKEGVGFIGEGHFCLNLSVNAAKASECINNRVICRTAEGD